MNNDKYLTMTSKELESDPSLIRITPENANQFEGYEVVFKTRGGNAITRIERVSPQGRTIYVDHPDLKNNLEIVSRRVYVIKNSRFIY